MKTETKIAKKTYIIPRIEKFKIYFRGIEPVVFIKYKKHKRITTNLHYGLFAPIYKFIRKLKLVWQFYNFKRLGITPEKCEGCGEGWATWMIDEPNGKPYSIVCCDDCVDFYDWKLSRRRIKYV